MEAKQWYVICYDITEPKVWRKVYKKLNGYGRRLQYSIFRCRLTRRQIEKLRWELEGLMEASDKLLILTLCEACERHVSLHNRPESWFDDGRPFDFA
ncbi:MAG: CRISPR-associated endonuclease Cas2 [Acidobacteriota bacterium]|jgi:CRISPR-associated protein Cas2|nr:CRISPR-associated endonuclease Cas2 [Acidobacteriota bacterium]